MSIVLKKHSFCVEPRHNELRYHQQCWPRHQQQQHQHLWPRHQQQQQQQQRWPRHQQQLWPRRHQQLWPRHHQQQQLWSRQQQLWSERHGWFRPFSLGGWQFGVSNQKVVEVVEKKYSVVGDCYSRGSGCAGLDWVGRVLLAKVDVEPKRYVHGWLWHDVHFDEQLVCLHGKHRVKHTSCG